jgi:hypothetical protein
MHIIFALLRKNDVHPKKSPCDEGAKRPMSSELSHGLNVYIIFRNLEKLPKILRGPLSIFLSIKKRLSNLKDCSTAKTNVDTQSLIL